jgi:energy-coupling factor transporter ATP-binding protein EcfA2
LVEVFDLARYNSNATLAENLLFGAPTDATFAIDRLAAHPYVQQTLERAGLTDTLVGVGLKVAETMVELFVDLPPDHEYYRQFSFISADDLPEYRALINRVDATKLDTLGAEDRQRLLALTFKLAPARHRLGLVEDGLQARILEARRLFREHLPPELAGSVAFFESDRYTAAASIQDNILFGKVAYGQAQASERIGELISEVLDELGLHGRVVEVGLQAETGVGGGRLSLAQRQKLALARALLKRPQILILYEATSSLDPTEQPAILDALLEEFAGRTLIWAVSHGDWAARFDHVLIMRNGRVVEQGRYEELKRDGSASLREMIAAE